MTKSVVFFDLDGTLLRDDKTVGSPAIAAISELRQRGSLPVISTGRDLWEIQDFMQTTGIDSAVCGNGATLLINGQVVDKRHIQQDLVAAINTRAAADDLTVAWYNETGAALSRADDLTIGNYQDVRQTPPPVVADYWRTHPSTRMLVFTGEAQAVQLQEQYSADFPELAFYHSSPFDLELIEKRISKESGIRTMRALPELAEATAYAFGDGDNDVPMSRAVDHMVAMANASSQLHEIADYTTGDNNGDGIAQGLRHFNLIA